MPDGRVEFEVTANNSNAKKTIDETTRHIAAQAKQWDNDVKQSAQSMESSIGKALKGIAAGVSAAAIGKQLVSLGMDAINLASDLEEVQNVVDVTFGDGAKQIQAWAEAAGTQFGLTETQAKKFTSTLGAMMKSAGLAGPEIVNMSTDMAGLAADMASFYNLDFETAFEKIRSGLSGQTEPLKQLGINMSVANLQAFALAQGIEKSFDKMTQGEQIMLRYQYMMQATADAQGDFARTSDGYANSLRTLETNIDSLKTKLGNVLIPALTDAITFVNDFLDAIQSTGQKTVLDDFAEIDLDTEKKIADITATADKARDLNGVLDKLSKTPASSTLKNLASGANELKQNSYTNWTNVLNALDGAGAKLPKMTDSLGITALAGALSGANLEVDKATAWKTFLGELSANAENLTSVTGTSATEIQSFLSNIADGVDDLDPDDPAAWDSLFSTFAEYFPGLKDTDNIPVLLSLETVAKGANALKANSSGNWTRVLTALQKVDGLSGLFSEGKDPAGNVTKLAEALSGAPNTSKKEAWKSFIGVLTDNVGTLTDLTGKDADSTKTWLADIAAAADDLSEDDVKGWDKLFTTFTTGLPGLKDENGLQMLQTLAGTATDFNKLKATSVLTWTGVLGALQKVEGLENVFGKGDAANKNIESLAKALSGNGVDMSTADAWKSLMGTLVENADAVSSLTGASTEETKKWLENIASAANEIDDGAVDSWDKLLTLLVGGMNGTDEGNKFIDSLAQEFLALGVGSKEAEANLAALGFSSDEIAEKQHDWLETCQRLVSTIPGLSSIINTETGEVKGGTAAVDDYIDAWENGQKKLLAKKALYAKQQAIQDKRAALEEMRLELYIAQEKRNRLEKLWLGEGGQFVANNKYQQEYYAAQNAAAELAASLDKQSEALERAIGDYEIAESVLDKWEDKLGIADEATQQNIDTATEWGDAQKKACTEVVNATRDAVQELANYYQQMYEATKSSVESTVKGFEEVETSEDRAAKKSKDITEQLEKLQEQRAKLNPKKDAEEIKKIDEQMADLNYEMSTLGQNAEVGAKSTKDIVAGLQDQINYMTQYMSYMDQAKRKGVDADLLAELSDGSTDSYEYLKALAEGGNIDQVNKLYRQARQKRDQMTKDLTDTKATADETYQDLKTTAENFIKELNKQGDAAEASSATIQGVADGIKAKLPEVTDAVDAIISELERLNGWSIDVTGYGSVGAGDVIDGSHATGLNWVPFDGYLAQLHEGEGILTAEENRIWQRFKTGGAMGVDYDTLGGVMRDNVHAGGNVYLEGRTVGRVISDIQGKSYRNLERSGWQQ